MSKRAAYQTGQYQIFVGSPDTQRLPDETAVPFQTTANMAAAVDVASTVLIKGRKAAKLKSRSLATTVQPAVGGVLSGTNGGPSVVVQGCETVLVEGLPIAYDGSLCLVNEANTEGSLIFLPGGSVPGPKPMEIVLDLPPVEAPPPPAPPIPLKADMTIQATSVLDAGAPPPVALVTPDPGCDPPPLVIPPYDPAARAEQMAQVGMGYTAPIGTTLIIGDPPPPTVLSTSEQGLQRAIGGGVEVVSSVAAGVFGGPGAWGPAAAGFVDGLNRITTGVQQYNTNQPVQTLAYEFGSGLAEMFGASPEEQNTFGAGVDFVVPLVIDLASLRPTGGTLMKVESKVTKGVFIEADGAADLAAMEARALNGCAAGKCVLAGEPVDVATGRVVTSKEDFRLEGPISVVLTRDYSSAWTGRDSPLGFGWSHCYDQAVWVEGSTVVYRAGDGREIEIQWPDGLARAPGAEVFEPKERLTLRVMGLQEWEVRTAEGFCHCFAAVGPPGEGRARLTAICAPTGQSLGFDYDGAGRLGQIRDAVGRIIRLEYNEAGRLEKTLLPHPAGDGWLLQTSYMYSPEGDLIEVRDALEQAIRYRYRNHLMVQVTDRTGLSFYYAYEAGVDGPLARCIRTWGDGGLLQRDLEYHPRLRSTRVTDSLGETTEYHFDRTLSLVQVIDPRGAITRAEYDVNERVTRIIDPVGNTVRFEYDERGNCLRRTLPDGTSEQVMYDAANRPTAAIRRGGGVFRLRYDERGCLVERVDPLRAKTAYQYDNRGLLTSIEHPGGGRTTLTRDAQGNVTRHCQPNGRETRFEHDRLSRITAVRGPAQRRPVRLRYDRAGRRSGIEDASGTRSVHFRFDGEGNVIEKLDREGKTLERIAYTGYHSVGSCETAGRQTLRIHYDTEDRVTAIEDGAGHVHRHVRDACGHVIEEQTFDGRTIRHAYDLAGRCIKTIQPSGIVAEHRFDMVARASETAYSDGSWTRFTYHPDGGLASAANATGTVSFDYDAAGNRVTEQQGEDRVWSRHAAGGRRVEIRSTAGVRIAIARDLMGDPTEVRAGAAAARRWAFQRDLDRAEVRRELPGGARVEWSRNEEGWPAQRRLLRGGDVLASRTYTWSNDRMVGVEDASGASSAYTYEADGAIGACYEKGRESLLARDRAGYSYRKADRSDRRYGLGGRLLAADEARFVYDADGQLREKVLPDGTSWKYSFDATGQLSEVVRPDGERVSFAYDALGRRVSKTAGGITTRWVWDGDTVLHEQRSDRAPVTWLFCPDSQEVLAKLEGAGSERCYSAVTDELGTPNAFVDEAGALAWQMQLDLYGVARDRTESATDCPWRWQGQYEDAETGLHYNRFRYYDPGTGRYISPDPIGLAGGPDLYGYVANPLTHLDPFGLAKCSSTVALGDGFGINMKEFTDATQSTEWSMWGMTKGKEALELGDSRLWDNALDPYHVLNAVAADPNTNIAVDMTTLLGPGRSREWMQRSPIWLDVRGEGLAAQVQKLRYDMTIRPGLAERVTFYVNDGGKFVEVPVPRFQQPR